MGLKTYTKNWKRAVEIFGENQVSSFIIAGIGEKPATIIEGAMYLSEMGVFPFVLPLRPIPGSLLENSRPPDADKMIDIYEEVSNILQRHGLSSKRSKAGCVRCGACSALKFFEN